MVKKEEFIKNLNALINFCGDNGALCRALQNCLEEYDEVERMDKMCRKKLLSLCSSKTDMVLIENFVRKYLDDKLPVLADTKAISSISELYDFLLWKSSQNAKV